MTAEQAKQVKKILKSEGFDFATPYYKSKTGELRLLVCESRKESASLSEPTINARIIKILNALSENGMRPKYHKEQKVYQGFIVYNYIVFD